MILNEKKERFRNPYPIEIKLRTFTMIPNSFVFGTLNCCREAKSSGITPGIVNSNQILLKFAASSTNLAIANEKFGNEFVNTLQKII